MLIKLLLNLEAMHSLNTNILLIWRVNKLNNIFFIDAFERGNGRRVDGRRVIVDVVRGRLDPNWLPRRLGGGRGGTRRDREDEKLIEEIKKVHPELRNRSRSRSRDHTKQGNESHHKKAERDKK